MEELGASEAHKTEILDYEVLKKFSKEIQVSCAKMGTVVP